MQNSETPVQQPDYHGDSPPWRQIMEKIPKIMMRMVTMTTDMVSAV